MTDRERLRGLVSPLLAVTRIGRFVSAGVVGTVVDNLVLVALVSGVGLAPTVGKVGSWEVGIAATFLLNDRWTFDAFRRTTAPSLLRRFLTSNAIRAGGFLVALAVLYVLYTRFEVWYLLANLVGIALGGVVNYAAESLLTWRVHARE